MITKHMWTASEIKRLITLWDTKSLEDLCKEFGLQKGQINGMRNAIRKEGYVLSTKRQVGRTRALINEVLSGMNLKRTKVTK